MINDNWKTPDYIYNQLNNEFNFDFDPCPYNEKVINKQNDGLLIDWGNCNFINPPYSKKLKEAFVKRAILMQKLGKTSVMLLPVSTSTILFHDYIKPNATEIRFLKGRIKFETKDIDGNFKTTNVGFFDSMLVIFKPL
jgi:site-specific DNA-methyltransferase (adenine-specific)